MPAWRSRSQKSRAARDRPAGPGHRTRAPRYPCMAGDDRVRDVRRRGTTRARPQARRDRHRGGRHARTAPRSVPTNGARRQCTTSSRRAAGSAAHTRRSRGTSGSWRQFEACSRQPADRSTIERQEAFHRPILRADLNDRRRPAPWRHMRPNSSRGQWARWESNPHAPLRELRILSPLRLPVPPQARGINIIGFLDESSQVQAAARLASESACPQNPLHSLRKSQRDSASPSESADLRPAKRPDNRPTLSKRLHPC